MLLRQPLCRARYGILLLITGCGSSHDYGVATSWLINGVAPDAALCDAFGVDTVRLSVEVNGKNRTLSAPCEDQITLSDGFAYGGFLTTDRFDYGEYYPYSVDMLDAQGRSIVGYDGSFEAFAGDFIPVELVPLELFDPFGVSASPPLGQLASVSAAWTVGSGDLAENCALAGITDVEIQIASITDFDFLDPLPVLSAPCQEGGLLSDGPILAYGEYQTKYVALDARGAVVEETPPEPATVFEAGELVLLPERFTLP